MPIPRSREASFAEAVAARHRGFPASEPVRRALDDLVRDTYRRLDRPLPSAALQAVQDPSTPLVQVAHDGQLPHLGVMRLVLKTAEVASLLSGVALYLLGDHYTAAMRPRNLYFGMPLRGIPPDRVKQPIRLPVSGKDKDVPFLYLPPPTPGQLASLYARAWDWMEKNIAYERSRGAAVTDVETISKRLETWEGALRREATRSESLGDWLFRLQFLLLDELYFDGWPALVLLPMSRFRSAIAEPLTEAARAAPDTDLGAGIWVFCPTCRLRSRPLAQDPVVRFRCPGCGTVGEEALDPTGPNQFPDIVTYEAAALPLFTGWIVGSQADYLPRIDALYMSRWQREPPPRAVLESVPVFHGLGEPREGYGRSRALRVLLETTGREISGPLSEPWDSNPVIHSAHLAQNGRGR